MPIPVWIRGLAGMLERGGGDFDIFLYGAAQAADRSILDDPGYLFHGMEIAGAGDGEAGFDDVDAKGLQLERQLDLFFGIELAARNLFAVAEGGVENENFLVSHMEI